MQSDKILGVRLKKLRGNKTQEDVAKSIGLSRGRYAHYETNRVEPDLETLRKLADYFNVTIDYLLGRSDDPNFSDKEYTYKPYNPLNEINKIMEDHEIKAFGFQDIEKWKNLSPEDVEDIKKHVEWVVHKAQQREDKE